MESSADRIQAGPRMGAVFRLLMQLRLLLVGVTMLLLIGTPLSVSAGLAISAAAFSSWLAAHYWERIMHRVLRHPILLALDVVVAFLVLELGGPLGPFFLFTVVTSTVAGLLFRWRGVACFCSLQVLCYFAALGVAGTEAVWSFQVMVGQPAYYPIVGFVGVRLRRLLETQESLAEAERRAQVEAAAANERARLARELHDSLAKTLRGIAMSAKALPMWVQQSPSRAVEEAERMASTAEVASQEARGLISELHSGDIDEPPADLVRKVTEEWANETGVAVRVDVADKVELPVLGRYEGVAVLKEALTNIERHAGAKHVDVTLTCEDGRGILVVRDDGSGFEPGADTRQWSRAGHYGLTSMHERAARAHGKLTVASSPGRGTTIEASFPLAATFGDLPDKLEEDASAEGPAKAAEKA